MGGVGAATECGEVRTGEVKGEVKGEVSTEALLSLECGAEGMRLGTDLSTTSPLFLFCSVGLS